MFTLPIEKTTLRTAKDHQYHVFPAPHAHENYKDRPTVYANEKILKTYEGKGSNGSAKLHPDVLAPANEFMSALLEYGNSINDWSIRSAVIASGYRPDDPAQGKNYLRIIKETIAENPTIFGALKFPESLDAEAQSVLGHQGDARRTAFHKNVAAAPGWRNSLEAQLFQKVDSVYAPRGSNPHATGFVFDLDFMIYDEHSGTEIKLGANPKHNSAALRNAAGLWLNTFSLQFGFDSYNTGIEIWHMEYRRHKSS